MQGPNAAANLDLRHTVGQGSVRVPDIESVRYAEAAGVGLKAEVARGVFVDAEAESGREIRFRPGGLKAGQVARAIRRVGADGRVIVGAERDVLHLPQRLQTESPVLHRVRPGEVLERDLVV